MDGIGRRIGRDVGAGPDHVAGLHAVTLAEDFGRRIVGAGRQARFHRERLQPVAGIFGRQPHRVAHVESGAGAERSHVVGRNVGVGQNDADVLGCEIEHLGDDQRHGGIGSLPHVDGIHVERDAAVGADVDDGDRGGWRDRRLEADGNAAPAPHHAGAAVEWRTPVHARRDGLQYFGDGGVPHRGAGRLRPVLAQDVVAAKRQRIDAERARNQIGVALIGPHQLRNAEAAQRAGRRSVGVDRVGADRHVVDVVGAGRGEARLLRYPRTNIRVGAAVPPHVAAACRDTAVARHGALDAKRRRVLGDVVELLFHGDRDLDRTPHQQRQCDGERFELDVDLGAETAAQERHLHPYAVFRPAE